MFVLFFVHLYMSLKVGAARKKYGISYPSLYAVPGTPRNYGPPKEAKAVDGTSAPPLSELCTAEDAYKYNSVQRGHQNSIESFPLILALSLVSWGFPIVSGFALLSWSLGRIFYFNGYTEHPDKRINPLAIVLTYPALFALWGLAITTAIHLFRGTPPYNYA